MHPRHPAPVAAALSGLLLIVGLAGCSAVSGGGTATPTPSPNAQQVAALYRELAQCLREHGVPNLPDPVQDPRTGDWELPPGTAKPPDTAMTACKSVTDRIPVPPGKQERPPTAAEMAKLKRFSQCMREQGLRDWPDPNENGAFPLPQRLEAMGKRGFVRQLQACKQYAPEGLRIESGTNAKPGSGGGRP